MERRTFFELLVKTGGLVTAAVLGVPALIYAIWPVLQPRPGPLWQQVGPVEEFPMDLVARAVVEVPRQDWAHSVRQRGVYVWRRTAREVVVYSRNCTDLSCPVVWDPGSQWFFCPCHGGIFSKEGERMAGPPKRPLFRYANRVRNGILEIDLYSLPPMT